MDLQKAEKLAKDLIGIHLDDSWVFAWNRRKTAIGTCSYRKGQIQLSRFFIEKLPEDKVKNTILHEIAHALTPGDKHGFLWYNKFVALGGSGETRSDVSEFVSIEDKGYKYCMKSPTGTILKYWLRKPNQSTFNKIDCYYEKGRKAETIGKCWIEKL